MGELRLPAVNSLLSLKFLTAIFGLLSFGTITSISAKLVYELKAPGLDGVPKKFEKPWFMVTLMFLGMSFCMPLAILEDRKKRSESAANLNGSSDSSQPLLSQVPEEDAEIGALNGAAYSSTAQDGGHSVYILMIPAVFDLIATALMNVGLLTVTASVYQMMRGAELLFAALFSITFLKRKLNKLHFGGIGFCITGLSLVGLSSAASGNGGAGNTVSPSQVVLGMGLIIASQAVQAAQITFEDFFMSGLSISPLKIVAYEGVFGFALMATFVLPLIHFLPGAEGAGIHEDTYESLHMIKGNRAIQIIMALDLVALCLYNITGMQVTGLLGAVSRTVLETSRTILVWIVGLVMFYAPLAGLGGLGEPWTAYSPLQAFGFCWLVAGTMTYVRGDILAATEGGAGAAELEEEDRESGMMATSTSPVPADLTGLRNASVSAAGVGGRALAGTGRGSEERRRGAGAGAGAGQAAAQGGPQAAVIHPTMVFQRTGPGINIRTNGAAQASSFKSSMSLMSTSLQQSSLRPGSYLLRGPGPTAVIGTTDSRIGPFGRMSGVE